jgi:hypothetical protein
MSGEYTYGVMGKGILNYRMPSGLSVELNYINYQRNQTAVINPYLEDRKVALSLPVHSRNFMAFLRLTLDQFILMKSNYISTEFLISGAVLGVSTNLTTYGMFSGPGKPSFNSTLSLGIRFPKRFVFTPQVQYDFSNNQFMSLKFGLEKSLFLHGVMNLSYEYNFWGSVSNLQIGMRYDFPFAQTGITANYFNKETTLGQSARGSLMFDGKTHYTGVTNRASVGKCGIVILPFLDFNGNGHRDPDEPKVTGLNFHIIGGRIEQSKRDSLIRVFDLEPFTSYFIEIDRSSFENVAWQIEKPTINVVVDPNQFKLVEVPVSVFGEISGTIYFSENGSLTGQGRIIVSFFRGDSIPAARTLSESDGYFNFLGLLPGSYTARIDSVQLRNLNMTATPERIPFTIKRMTDGDQVGGMEFVLHSFQIDTTKLLAKAAENKVPAVQEQQLVPEKEKIQDSVKEQKKEVIIEKKEMASSIPSQTSRIKPVITDSTGAIAKLTENPVPQTREPEILPVKTKQTDTISAGVKKKIPETTRVVPSVSPQLSFEMPVVADSGDFVLQSNVSYALPSALKAQKELADAFRRPVIIISEGGICKLRIAGFYERKEAELVQSKLAGMGFPGTYILCIRGYSIQVGAFHVRAYALASQSHLAASFSRPVLIVLEDEYYKVRITGFNQLSDANKFVPELNDHGFPETYLLNDHQVRELEATLLAKAAENKVPAVQEQQFIEETETIRDSILVKEQRKEVIAVSPPLTVEMPIIDDSCDFVLQTSVSFTLASALKAQQELSDTFRRPVMIISEGGICKLRIIGFCGRKEAELFLSKLTGMGFPGSYLLRIRGYSIQVGAFHVRAYALAIQSRLAASFSRPIFMVFEDGYYKVRITGFARYSEAKKFIPELNDHGFPETYLLKSH